MPGGRAPFGHRDDARPFNGPGGRRQLPAPDQPGGQRENHGESGQNSIRPTPGQPEGDGAHDQERAEGTALREVREETGVEATPVEKLGDVRYVYTWEGERVFKVVSFFLFRYRAGRLGDIPPERAALMADTTLTIVTGEEFAAEDQLYREMRGKLEAMGPVNMMALEEYKETAERHTFLDTQRKDLISSIENTTATIREIDEFSRQKFEEAFTKINENFQATFKKLFGGGHAFMKLTDEENSAESGIDVVASPPGKRLQNVLLLSGGEKALTALSLLVGIFQYAPSPFCILDEVDAPLDEANIGRFTELVKEMSVQTQFVLITHSKKTMSIAPVLYGVTMQEPGVSKLVSVRFGAA